MFCGTLWICNGQRIHSFLSVAVGLLFAKADDIFDFYIISCMESVPWRKLGRRRYTYNGSMLFQISEEYKQKSGYKMGTDLEKKFFLTRKMTAKSPAYINSREVVGRYKLPPGDYVIVPTTFDANQQGNFMLRIYTEKKVTSQWVRSYILLLNVLKGCSIVWFSWSRGWVQVLNLGWRERILICPNPLSQ